MQTAKIMFRSVADAERFVSCAERYPNHMDIQCGNRMVDAKSLLGVIGLGVERKLNLKIYGDGCEELLNNMEFCTVD